MTALAPWVIAMVWIGGIVLYGFGVGVTWALLPELDKNAHDTPPILATLFALCWPVVLPMLAGAHVVARLRRPTIAKATAREVRR